VLTGVLLGYGPLLGIERPEGSSQKTLQLANLFEHLSMFFLRLSDHTNLIIGVRL
jgi:hypothetical protein